MYLHYCIAIRDEERGDTHLKSIWANLKIFGHSICQLRPKFLMKAFLYFNLLSGASPMT